MLTWGCAARLVEDTALLQAQECWDSMESHSSALGEWSGDSCAVLSNHTHT